MLTQADAFNKSGHGGADIHLFYQKLHLSGIHGGIADRSTPDHAEVRSTLWIYTDKAEIQEKIQSEYCQKIEAEINNQYNRFGNNFTTQYKYRVYGKDPVNTIPFVELHFNITVRYLDGLYNVDAAGNYIVDEETGYKILSDKVKEGINNRENYCFIHLNDGNFLSHPTDAFAGFTDGNVGSWSIADYAGKSNDFHFAHEMAHLLGYLNVVRKYNTPCHYFGSPQDLGFPPEEEEGQADQATLLLARLTAAQHPTQGFVAPEEKLGIMIGKPGRHVVQRDINNLNFGQGLLVENRYWSIYEDCNPNYFISLFHHGIWGGRGFPGGLFEPYEPGFDAKHYCMTVGQKRPNDKVVFFTHANLIEKRAAIRSGLL